MMHAKQEWAEKILSGDRRAIARAISAIEKGEPAGAELLKRVFLKTGGGVVSGLHRCARGGRGPGGLRTRSCQKGQGRDRCCGQKARGEEVTLG